MITMTLSALFNGNLTLSSSSASFYFLNNNTFKSRNYNFFIHPSNVSTPLRLSRRRNTVSSCVETPVDASIDLKLPRRSLSVQFTCSQCGEKTKRLVNRLAYERGAVFVQCGVCLKHHKLVDNLGLIVEYSERMIARTWVLIKFDYNVFNSQGEHSENR
ncbi:hypothetical protein MKX01_004732 [Papaver californicum]|nr:hypothetical protein MKX01_004732 [Papaver californicum]